MKLKRFKYFESNKIELINTIEDFKLNMPIEVFNNKVSYISMYTSYGHTYYLPGLSSESNSKICVMIETDEETKETKELIKNTFSYYKYANKEYIRNLVFETNIKPSKEECIEYFDLEDDLNSYKTKLKYLIKNNSEITEYIRKTPDDDDIDLLHYMFHVESQIEEELNDDGITSDNTDDFEDKVSEVLWFYHDNYLRKMLEDYFTRYNNKIKDECGLIMLFDSKKIEEFDFFNITMETEISFNMDVFCIPFKPNSKMSEIFTSEEYISYNGEEFDIFDLIYNLDIKVEYSDYSAWEAYNDYKKENEDKEV